MARISHTGCALRRAGNVRVLQKLAYHGAQPHRTHRLVQQMMAAGARFAQAFGCGVAADQEGRNVRPQRFAQSRDRDDAGLSIAQPEIGDDQVGAMILADRRERGIA